MVNSGWNRDTVKDDVSSWSCQKFPKYHLVFCCKNSSIYIFPCATSFNSYWLRFFYISVVCSRNICENHSSTITCFGGKKIHILKAVYGRTNRHVCPSNAIKTTRCRSGRSYNIVRRKCNGKSSCWLKASNNVFGDPCVGTYKYLEVVHACR